MFYFLKFMLSIFFDFHSFAKIRVVIIHALYVPKSYPEPPLTVMEGLEDNPSAENRGLRRLRAWDYRQG